MPIDISLIKTSVSGVTFIREYFFHKVIQKVLNAKKISIDDIEIDDYELKMLIHGIDYLKYFGHESIYFKKKSLEDGAEQCFFCGSIKNEEERLVKDAKQ